MDRKTANKADVTPNKITQGRLKFGAAVELKLINDDHLDTVHYIAEGPETALSILVAKPDAKVKAVLSKGNFTKIKDEPGKSTVFCLDNDDNDKALRQLIAKLTPEKDQASERSWSMPPTAKTDFNDMLKEQVPTTIADHLDNETYPIKAKIEIKKIEFSQPENHEKDVLKSQENLAKIKKLLSVLGDKIAPTNQQAASFINKCQEGMRQKARKFFLKI